MRKLSDFKGEEAIDLWADIMETASVIFTDPEVKKHAGESTIEFAKALLKLHKKEVCDILLAIDDTPINGMNILIRLISVFNELGADPTLKDFFAMQGQNAIKESSGSATGNTKGKEH